MDNNLKEISVYIYYGSIINNQPKTWRDFYFIYLFIYFFFFFFFVLSPTLYTIYLYMASFREVLSRSTVFAYACLLQYLEKIWQCQNIIWRGPRNM